MTVRSVLFGVGLALAGCAAPSLPEPATPPPPADILEGTVVRVPEGDRLILRREGVETPVRLSGIDCPELDQAFGKQAQRFASGLTAEGTISVKRERRDKDGSTAGIVTLPDGRNLNRELVRSGLCWWRRDDPGDERLPILEAEAHAARRGLWAQREPIPPWKWRGLKVKPQVREKDE